jgi:hypothetical protein
MLDFAVETAEACPLLLLHSSAKVDVHYQVEISCYEQSAYITA